MRFPPPLGRELTLVLVVWLQSDIMDVNQIFKDLAVMIHDQGEMIGEKKRRRCRDTIFFFPLLRVTLHLSCPNCCACCFADSIEANVENAEVHVERGTEQLQRASYYQVSSSSALTR